MPLKLSISIRSKQTTHRNRKNADGICKFTKSGLE